jgi:hypothetical protein
MKIYISGQITGLDLDEARQHFNSAESQLTTVGHEVINPMSLVPYQEHLTWKDYMIEDIKALFECDAIFMLDNWRHSRGAKIEHDIAQGLGIKVYYSTHHNLF